MKNVKNPVSVPGPPPPPLSKIPDPRLHVHMVLDLYTVADPGCGERGGGGGGAPIHPSQACGGWVTQ